MLSNQNKPGLIHDQHQLTQFAGDPAVVATALEAGVTSIDRVEELPEPLRYLKDQLPGLLLWHQPVDGGDPVPLFRPDKPKDGGPKYISAKGADAGIFVVPAMAARLGADVTSCAKSVLIVEGEKQHLFASTYAPDDVISVGIQGCWGWSRDKQALPVLDRLGKSRHVVVAFDADVATNEHVYHAAKRLSLSLVIVGAKSVKFLLLPAGGHVGLDDFLAQRDRGNRGDTLRNLISTAQTFNKIPKPKAKLKISFDDGTFDIVSTVLGEIVEVEFESMNDSGKIYEHQLLLAYAGEVDGRRVRRVKTLLGAAVTIAATVEEINDLSPGAEPHTFYDLKVQYGAESDPTYRHIKGVAYSELKYVERWLERLGGDFPRVTLGRAATTPSGQSRVAEAIKGYKCSDEVKRKEFLRTGWYLDSTESAAYWLDTGGAHGPEGKSELLRAKIEGSLSSLDVPGFVEHYNVEEAAASFRKLVSVCGYLNDPTPWIALVAGLIWSVFGGNPDALLFLTGPAGVGKTTIASTLSSVLGSAWGPNKSAMVSMQGTLAYLADVSSTIHNCMMIVDDVRDRSSLRSQQDQDNAVDQLVRVGYGGGGAARGKKVVDDHKKWIQSTLSNNRPFVVIVGESMPDTTTLSTIERSLTVEITAATSMKKAGMTPDRVSGLEYLVNLAESGALRPALSFFLYKTAERITAAARGADGSAPITNLDQWRILSDELRSQYAATAMAKHWPPKEIVSERVRKVAATFLAGTTLFTNFMVNEGFLSSDEAAKIEDQWHTAIIAAAIGHARANLSQSDEAQLIIDTLRGAVATGRARLVGTSPEYAPASHENEHAPIIGAYLSVNVAGKTISVVAVIVGVTSKILSEEGFHIPPRGLPRRLRSVLITDEKGERTHVQRIPGMPFSQRCYFIPQETWAPRSAALAGESPEEWAAKEEGADYADADMYLYEDEESIEDVDEAWTPDDDELA